ncbi:mechanosensitive ion channel family protein [Vibrio sonorensis]|uniref:mechanosensitive ion channel family protein n=1 Tax=Vibrio sonorensis TaxID=1004316 RepID=UPI0009FDD16B|nr:mechanosensitive ion channel family protein [Vibrio sonorensis]
MIFHSPQVVLVFCLLTVFLPANASEANKPLAPNLGFPLAPADTRSPYSTLTSFLTLTEEAGSLLQTMLKREPSLTDSFDPEQERRIEDLVKRAQSCFNLANYPSASRHRIGLESVLLLNEILKRVPPFDLTKIPGAPEHQSEPMPTRWRIPATQIYLAKNALGDYQIAPDSINDLRQFYKQIVHLPAADPSAMDLYQFFESSPGTLVPPDWFYYLSSLPDPLFVLYGDQAVWQWIFFVILTCAFLILLYWIWCYQQWLKREVIGASALALSIKTYLWLLTNEINIGGKLMYQLTLICELLIWPLLALAIYQGAFRLMNTLASLGVQDSLEQSMVKVLSTIVSFVAAITVVSYGATRIGIPVYGIVTSLSLGGMAIALAIRPTMENFIGGVILYLDKAIQVGDYCEFEDVAGTVESIGIRSTKIRALDRTLITIANGSLVRMKLTNYSRRDKFHFRTTLSVSYQTSMETLSQVIEALKRYLKHQPNVAQQPLRVNFTQFANCSLQIDIHAYIYALDRSAFLNIQQTMLFDIAEIMAQHSVDFAYPTQTLYLKNTN